jgi:antirestriction protein
MFNINKENINMEQVQQQETKHGVYFANLEAYNQGRMVGGWLYPLDYETLGGFLEAIKQVTRNADEVAVHDYDDFPNMGEYPMHDELYEMIHAVNDSHLDNEILFKFMDNQHDYSSELVLEAEDLYMTTCDNFKDFAYDLADQDIEINVNKEAQQFVMNNFDYEGYARDLQHSYYVIDLNNYDVAIFSQ